MSLNDLDSALQEIRDSLSTIEPAQARLNEARDSFLNFSKGVSLSAGDLTKVTEKLSELASVMSHESISRELEEYRTTNTGLHNQLTELHSTVSQVLAALDATNKLQESSENKLQSLANELQHNLKHTEELRNSIGAEMARSQADTKKSIERIQKSANSSARNLQRTNKIVLTLVIISVCGTGLLLYPTLSGDSPSSESRTPTPQEGSAIRDQAKVTQSSPQTETHVSQNTDEDDPTTAGNPDIPDRSATPAPLESPATPQATPIRPINLQSINQDNGLPDSLQPSEEPDSSTENQPEATAERPAQPPSSTKFFTLRLSSDRSFGPFELRDGAQFSLGKNKFTLENTAEGFIFASRETDHRLGPFQLSNDATIMINKTTFTIVVSE